LNKQLGVYIYLGLAQVFVVDFKKKQYPVLELELYLCAAKDDRL